MDLKSGWGFYSNTNPILVFERRTSTQDRKPKSKGFEGKAEVVEDASGPRRNVARNIKDVTNHITALRGRAPSRGARVTSKMLHSTTFPLQRWKRAVFRMIGQAAPLRGATTPLKRKTDMLLCANTRTGVAQFARSINGASPLTDLSNGACREYAAPVRPSRSRMMVRGVNPAQYRRARARAHGASCAAHMRPLPFVGRAGPPCPIFFVSKATKENVPLRPMRNAADGGEKEKTWAGGADRYSIEKTARTKNPRTVCKCAGVSASAGGAVDQGARPDETFWGKCAVTNPRGLPASVAKFVDRINPRAGRAGKPVKGLTQSPNPAGAGGLSVCFVWRPSENKRLLRVQGLVQRLNV